jgi:dTDP-4-dehydrorhamnose 3,5-epimerase
MTFQETEFKGLIEIFPRVFGDSRGFFLESFRADLFKSNGITDDFIQDNLSFSSKGVVRGLHFQRPPFAQGKLVKVIQGKVLDVVVDLRPDSETFGKAATFVLDAERQNMLYVPPGFGHGFTALEDSLFFYKCTNVYNKEAEGGVLWNSPSLQIDWQVEHPIVSEKDLIYNDFNKTDFEFFRGL